MQKITDKLCIGNVDDALVASKSISIDVIIYLGQEIPERLCFSCLPTCIHVPLVDGRNEPAKIKNAVLVSCLTLNNDNRVMIACRAGISRSVLIATAVYAIQNNVDFDSAFLYVMKLHPESLPEHHLLRVVEQVTEVLRKTCSS